MNEQMQCPACGQELRPRGQRLFCGDCAGVMVSKDELAGMLEYIYPDDKRPLAQQLAPHRSQERACPTCRARMDGFRLNGVAIDQCFTHGFWFDRDELEKALQGTNTPDAITADFEKRHFAADQMELGWLYAVIKQAFRQHKRRREAEADEAAAAKTATTARTSE